MFLVELSSSLTTEWYFSGIVSNKSVVIVLTSQNLKGDLIAVDLRVFVSRKQTNKPPDVSQAQEDDLFCVRMSWLISLETELQS